MRSAINKIFSGVVLAAAISLTACTKMSYSIAPEPLNQTLTGDDPAIAARRWAPSVTNYASDTVKAGGISTFALPTQESDHINVFTETPLFLANTVYLPVSFFTSDSPFHQNEYKSIDVPPTFTAMPPLPPIGGVDSTPALTDYDTAPIPATQQ